MDRVEGCVVVFHSLVESGDWKFGLGFGRVVSMVELLSELIDT